MTTYRKRILVLTSCEKRGKELSKFLTALQYEVHVQTHLSSMVEDLIRSGKLQAVICDNRVSTKGGISIFQTFSEYFNQIPFFLILDEFDSDEVMICLEAGISNLFFAPLSKEAIVKKIASEFNKLEKVNILNSTGFREFFEESFTPKMVITDGVFTSGNTMLNELNPAFCQLAIGKSFEDIFLFNTSKVNSLNFKRFTAGVSHSVKIRNVKDQFTESAYDILLFRPANAPALNYIVEMVPLKAVCSEDGEIKLDAEIIAANSNGVKLTEREKEVLKLSASGMPIKVIAEELKLSNRTVEKHRANIMEKFGANNIIEAIKASLVTSKKQQSMDYFLN